MVVPCKAEATHKLIITGTVKPKDDLAQLLGVALESLAEPQREVDRKSVDRDETHQETQEASKHSEERSNLPKATHSGRDPSAHTETISNQVTQLDLASALTFREPSQDEDEQAGDLTHPQTPSPAASRP